MKFESIVKSVVAQYKATNKVVVYLDGAPGGGKSACTRAIAAELAKEFNIPAERIVEFNPSLREPCDILGLPSMEEDHCKWLPPEEFYNLRDGVGPCILILEELSDAGMNMQNPLCRIILDRYAGGLKLSDQLYILASGNRTEDRSGANRLSTKLGNRMRTIHFDTNLDEWCKWAAKNEIQPELVGFIRFRPELLHKFDPKQTINPTPRSWEDVSRIPTSLAPDVYMEHVAGSVGEGAAAEYIGFLRIFSKLPDMGELLKHPDTAEVPSEPSVLYAICAKLSSLTTRKNFENIMKFVLRLPPEFGVMYVQDAMQRCRAVTATKAFSDFCMKHNKLLLG